MKKHTTFDEAKYPLWDKVSTIKFYEHSFILYTSGLSKVQGLFPDLSENEHKLILTGIYNACYNELFNNVITNTRELVTSRERRGLGLQICLHLIKLKLVMFELCQKIGKNILQRQQR